MHPKQFESVNALPADERYSYFVRKVADYEGLWGLYDGGWAIMAEDDGSQVFPIWPEREFAESLASGSWASYEARTIELDHFIRKWIPGMTNDGICPAVFPTATGKGVVITPERLAEDINEELEQYE